MRDATRAALHGRLSGLRAELGQVLGHDAARWYAFGFNRPADGEQSGPVEHLVVTAGAAGSGMLLADWDDARRASRYRVFRQIVGVDATPVEVTSMVTESDFTLRGLPTAAVVNVYVVPVNDACDGPASATVRGAVL